MPKDQALKIKKLHLVGIASWLNEQQLAGKESRERTRFVGILAKEVEEFNKERNEIVNKYAEKDEKTGKPKTIVDNGTENFDIKKDKLEAYTKEMVDLQDEEFVLDIGEGHKSKIKTVKDILLNTDYQFGPKEGDDPKEKEAKLRQAGDYAVWCEYFEALEI